MSALIALLKEQEAERVSYSFRAGDALTWRYGSEWQIPCVFVRYTRKGWAIVDVLTGSGFVQRNVRIVRLQPRVKEEGWH